MTTPSPGRPERPPAEGRRALVTGASRGIGRAIALALADAGHRVVGASRTGAGDDRVAGIACDLGDLDGTAGLPARAEAAAGGPIDILVHAAGVTQGVRLTRIALADWEATMRVNTTAAFVLAQRCLPGMAERGWGRLVTVGSLYSRMGARNCGAYAASKHALLGLTRVVAMEHATDGITANCVVPGWTDTDMVAAAAERAAAAHGGDEAAALRHFMRDQPLGRLVRPTEVAALVVHLCGDAAAAITGQAINVDGGSLQS